MDIASRILTCRLIEKMEQTPLLGKQLGLKNTSRYRMNLARATNKIDEEGEKKHGKKNKK